MELLNYLFEASILLTLLCLVYYLFLKSSTFHNVNRWYLLGSLLLSAIIPLVQFPQEVMQQSFSYSLPIIEINGSTNHVNNFITESFNWFNFFTSVYVFVVLVFMLILSIKYLQLFIKTKNICFQKYQNFHLYFGEYNSTAFSFFKYIFIPNIENEKEKQVLLQHEVAHAKALHSFDILWVELFKCLLWFHPIIYWLRNELVAQHEFAIDRKLTRTNFSVQQYGQYLISQTQTQPAYLSVTNFFNKSLIKNRIKMMTSKKSKKRIVLNYLFALTLVVSTCIFMIACEQNTLDSDAISLKDAGNVAEFQAEENLSEINDRFHKEINELGNIIKTVFSETEIGGKLEGLSETKLEDIDKLLNEVRANTISSPKQPIYKKNKPTIIYDDDDRIYEIVDEMPEFPGGDQALLDFLYGNIQYPEEARKDSIQGLAVVGFIVEKDGNITEFEILRSIGGGTDPEVVRVINLMPKWIPGKENGETVRVAYKLPIRFKLN